MILALSLTVALAATAPSTPFRLYSTAHATTCLDEVEQDLTIVAQGGHLDGVSLSVLSYGLRGPGGAFDTCDVVRRARSLGVDAHPATRVYVSADADTLLTPEWWTERADELAVLARCVDPDTRFMALDVEDYGGAFIPSADWLAARGMSVQDLAAIMRPFLDEVADLRIGAYPLNVDDEAHGLIGESAISLEIWSEHTFNDPHRARRSVDEYRQGVGAYADAHAAYRARWPGAFVRAGADDAYLRLEGFRAREMMPKTNAPLGVWAWRSDRLTADSARICSRGWYKRTFYDSRNDVTDAWTEIGRNVVRDWGAAYRSDLRKYAGGLNNNPTTTAPDGLWTVPAGQQMEHQHDVAPGGALTVAFDMRIKSQPHPAPKILFGRVRAIGSGDQNHWSLSATLRPDGAYDLSLAGAGGANPTVFGQVALGETVRVSAVVDHAASTSRVEVTHLDGVQQEHTVPIPSSLSTYHLFGWQPVYTPHNGEIEMGNVTVSERAWTSDELSRDAPSAAWPWGTP